MARKKRKTTEVPEEQRPLIKRLDKGKNKGKNDKRAEPGLDEAIADGLREAAIATAMEMVLPGGSVLALQTGKGLKPMLHNVKTVAKKGTKPFVKNAAEVGIKKGLGAEEEHDEESSPANSLATEVGENIASDVFIKTIGDKLIR